MFATYGDELMMPRSQSGLTRGKPAHKIYTLLVIWMKHYSVALNVKFYYDLDECSLGQFDLIVIIEGFVKQFRGLQH